jgi:hypothetical protein
MRDTVFLTRRRSDDKRNVVAKMTRCRRNDDKKGERMANDRVTRAFLQLTGGDDRPPAVERAVTGVLAVARDPEADASALLDALVLLRWAQTELAAVEPALITAARTAGVSWQELAPALGVASRQAAERRYLRLAPASADQPDGTRDDRVRAERDRRAGQRAVDQWANDNTADLRRLAGQVTALTDLGDGAEPDVARLHRALADADASALPELLAGAHRHLDAHPGLAGDIDTVRDNTDRVRRQTQQQRDATAPAGAGAE